MARRLIAVAGLAAGVGCANLGVHESEELEQTGGAESAAMRYQQRLNRDGTMPENALWKAKLRRDQMVAEHGGSAGPDTTWTWIGPGNVGGRLRAILINPSDANTMYVGAAGGGVWKTTNGGTSWFVLPDFVPSLSVASLAFLPGDPNTIYAGTGEGFFDAPEGSSNSANVRGAGIFKSTDAGATWNQIPATADANWYFVTRLGFQPGSSQVMLAATASGVWRSTDAGATWSQRTAIRTFDIEWDPTNNGKAVAGAEHGIAQYSTDGGVTWNNCTGIPTTTERIELTYAPSNTSIVYAAVSNGSGTTTMSVYRSTDGGQSYTLMGGGMSQLSSYTGVLWVDPLNPANIILGTQSLYRSTNSGVSFSTILGSVHADNHFIAQHPQYNGSTNRTIFFATDGGIYRTSDWSVASPTSTNLNNNLGVTQFYGAAVNDASGVVLAGAQDNGTNRYTGSPQGWTKNVIGGDGGYCASDPTDPNFFYGESQRLGIGRSTNGGASFSANVGYPYIPDGNTLNCNFIPYFMLDPNNPARMLACGRSLWRTDNVKTGTPTWVAIKQPLTFLPDPPTHRPPPQDHYSPNDPRNISTCAVAQGNSDVIWVGHNNGQLYKTTNGTAASPAWTRMDTNAPAWPGRWVSRIVIDPNNSDHVYVSLMGYATDNVWRTIDGGLTWQNISGTGSGALPAVPVVALAQHRLAAARLFAGTDVGLFESDTDGASWYPIGPEVGPVEVQELVWRNNTTLMAATFGRGVYQGSISTVLNDACAGMLPLFDGQTAYSTLGATTDGPSEPNCNLGADPQIYNDIWYVYIASCTGTTTLSLCNSDFDTKVAVYDGVCPSGPGTAIACNDNSCGTSGLASSVSWPSVYHHTYTIRIGGAAGASGSGFINLSCAPCYANCDGSTTAPVLNILDFSCFLNRFAAGDTWANCDGSTTPPVLNILDFSCFLNAFASGCS